MPELKKCPFCGSEKLTIRNNDWLGKWNVECNICSATTGLAKNKQRAIDAWNKRS